jgi:hypothetical protein
MVTMLKFQPAPHTDHITADGTELTKLPYPVYADKDGIGQLGTEPIAVIGFVADLSRQQVDLRWADMADPQQAVGQYIIIRKDTLGDECGRWATLAPAIASVTEVN